MLNREQADTGDASSHQHRPLGQRGWWKEGFGFPALLKHGESPHPLPRRILLRPLCSASTGSQPAVPLP